MTRSARAGDWSRTRITDLVGLEVPLVQGPFGSGLSSVGLAAAVSNAGGLGSYGAQHHSPDELTSVIAELRAATDRAFNVNLWVSTHDIPETEMTPTRWKEATERLRPIYDELEINPPAYPDTPFAYDFETLSEALIAARPPVFSFVYGVPDQRILGACRDAGIVTIGTAITVDEAVALDEAGVDAIVVSGFEAGGHRVAFLRDPEDSLIGTLSLVPMAVDAVSAPVIAAGGIADPRQIVAALALGADAVQIGTAFLATEQSGATPEHRAALSRGDRHTRLTRVLTGRLARGLSGPLMYDIPDGDVRIAPYPYQSALMRPITEAARERGREDLLAFWSGQSAPLVRGGMDAAGLLRQLVDGTDRLLD